MKNLHREAFNLQTFGLFAINGVDPRGDASRFFLGWLVGCTALLERLADDAQHQAFMRKVAQCTPEELTKAMLMVQCFQASDPSPAD